jgi:hypothetical protein
VLGAEGVDEESAAPAWGVRARQLSRPVNVIRRASLRRLISNIHAHSTANTSQQELHRGLSVAHCMTDQLRNDQRHGLDNGLHPNTPHEAPGLVSCDASGADVMGQVVPLRRTRSLTGATRQV